MYGGRFLQAARLTAFSSRLPVAREMRAALPFPGANRYTLSPRSSVRISIRAASDLESAHALRLSRHTDDQRRYPWRPKASVHSTPPREVVPRTVIGGRSSSI